MEPSKLKPVQEMGCGIFWNLWRRCFESLSQKWNVPSWRRKHKRSVSVVDARKRSQFA
jgi:hypothetical protein